MAAVATAFVSACGGGGSGNSPSAPAPSPSPSPSPTPTPTPTPIKDVVGVDEHPVSNVHFPRSMQFLPDGKLIVTSATDPTDTSDAGQADIALIDPMTGAKTIVTGLRDTLGVLDVVAGPTYSFDHRIYFSYEELGDSSTPRIGRGASDPSLPSSGLAVGYATLFYSGGVARLDDIHVIWRQTKIVSEGIGGEPGGAIVISPDFKYLFISAGDRQEFTPVQQLSNTVGKIVRIGLDGSIPTDNPFTTTADAAPEIWTLGHRNAYGLAFDANGELWEHEMGPLGGDEFNLLEPGGNYGWPNVSWGDNYDGTPITKPSPNDGYVAPAYYWTPAIAPAGMFFYHGGPFAAWNGEAILGGLQSHGIVRVAVDGKTASEVGRIALGARIRDVTEGPDGNIWVLEDTPTGRVIRLTPVYG